MDDRDEDPGNAPAVAWWRDPARRNRIVLVTFASLALLGILFPAFTKYLFAGDRRILVVTLANGAGQERREALKQTCGVLPGIDVIADRGNSDPTIQGRFPVRFDIADTSTRQYAALLACLDANEERFQIAGYLPENDGN